MSAIIAFLDAHPWLVIALAVVGCYADFRLATKPLLVRGLTLLEAIGVGLPADALAKAQATAEGEVDQATSNVVQIGGVLSQALKKAGGPGLPLVLLAVMFLSGCSAAITHDDVVNLTTAIHHERDAVAPRPGLDAAVAVERAGVDALLAAMEQATR